MALSQPGKRVQGECMKTFNLLFKTSNQTSQLILRLALAAVIFPHGAQKVLGWFGGYGFTGTMGFFTGTMHIPAILAFLAIMAEFAGPLGLFTGLLSRVAAFGIASTMVVAILTVHAANGFFMNWTGKQAGEGFEYHLLVLGMALAIIVGGAGKWSLDGLISSLIDKSDDK